MYQKEISMPISLIFYVIAWKHIVLVGKETTAIPSQTEADTFVLRSNYSSVLQRTPVSSTAVFCSGCRCPP